MLERYRDPGPNAVLYPTSGQVQNGEYIGKRVLRVGV